MPIITPEQIKHLDKLFGKDNFGEIPKKIRSNADYKRVVEECSEDRLKVSRSNVRKNGAVKLAFLLRDVGFFNKPRRQHQ